MKISKHKETYYEKVVTWEKEPNPFYITSSIIAFIWGVYGLIASFIGLAGSFNQFTFYIFSLTFIIVGIFTFIEGSGRGRKAKYRKIGK